MLIGRGKIGLTRLETALIIISVVLVIALILVGANYSQLVAEYNDLRSYVNYLQDQNNAYIAKSSWSYSTTIGPYGFTIWGLTYVPAGCYVVGTVQVSAGGPVDVYVGDWVSAMIYYTYKWGISSLENKWVWNYQWYGSYIDQTITLTSPYQNYYAIVIYNPNDYGVSVTASFQLYSINC